MDLMQSIQCQSRPTDYHCQSLIWYICTSTPTKLCYDYVIVVYIHHILWTIKHFHKEFVRNKNNYVSIRKEYMSKKWFIEQVFYAYSKNSD